MDRKVGHIPGLLFLFLLAPLQIWSQAEDRSSIEDYLFEAETAISEERYEAARNILLQGKNEYPDDASLPFALGELYFDKQLYALALDEYKLASHLNPGGYEEMYNVTVTYGKLNRNEESVELLEKMLEIFPEDLDVVLDLSWMYTKILKHQEARTLILDKLKVWPENVSLMMTLGTVYFGLYEYSQAREAYMGAIRSAEAEGYSLFASIAWNNLGLLEMTFYNYNNALACVESSMRHRKRAPALLSKGDLAFLKMDYQGAWSSYNSAFQIDETPLTKLSMAELHLVFGNLEAAELLLMEIGAREDASWMHNFGIDVDRFNLWKLELERDLYSRYVERQKKVQTSGFFKGIGKWAKGIFYSLKEWYFSRKHAGLSKMVGFAYLKEGNDLDADWTFFEGSVNYRSTALTYLRSARDFEIQIAPKGAASYDLEEGLLMEDAALLRQSISHFDPYWEKRQTADAYIGLIPLLEKSRHYSDARDAARELYDLLPPAFMIHPVDLPVVLEGDFPGSFRRLLNRSGFRILPVQESGPDEFRLGIVPNEEDQVRVFLRDGAEYLVDFTFPLTAFSGEQSRALIGELQKEVFYPHL